MADLELSFQAEIAPELTVAPGSPEPADYFRMAELLREVQPLISGLAGWSQIEAQVYYAVGAVAGSLDSRLEGEIAARWADWRERYFGELNELLRELRRQAAERSQERAASLSAAIDPHLPAERRSESLSRKALWTVMSTPGVTCVLNGMRTPAFVTDATGVLGWPALVAVEPVYRAASAALRDFA